MIDKAKIIAELFKLRELYRNAKDAKDIPEQNYFRGHIDALIFALDEDGAKTLQDVFLP